MHKKNNNDETVTFSELCVDSRSKTSVHFSYLI